jgi:plasmid maintenance system killer protein
MTAIPMAEQDDDPFKLFTRVKSQSFYMSSSTLEIHRSVTIRFRRKLDFLMVDEEIGGIRKAMAQAGLSRGSAAGCSLVATEKEESLLSRSSIRKAPRFPHQPSISERHLQSFYMSSSTLEIHRSVTIRFRRKLDFLMVDEDVVQRFGMTAIPMAEQDDDPFKLFTRVKSMKTW